MGYVLTNKGSYADGIKIQTAYYHDGTYLWTGDGQTDLTLRILTFNGTSFSVVDDLVVVNGSAVRGMWGDGTYVYTVNMGTQLRAYRAVNGIITAVGNAYTNTGLTCDCIYCDSLGYIYVGISAGMRVFTFNGTDFSLRYSYSIASGICQTITGDGTNLYFSIYLSGTYTRIYRATFDGSTITIVATYEIASTRYISASCHDGTYLVVGTSDGHILLLQTSDMTLLDDYNGSTTADVGKLGTDGYFIYAVFYNLRLSVFLRSDDSLGIPISTIADVLIADAGNSYRQQMLVRAPYVYYTSGPNARAARMDLTAQFTADKLTGIAPLTVQFTAV